MTSDCTNGAQCFAGRCIPQCQRNPECGDGFTCRDGTCVAAAGVLGGNCASETQCGAGLSCRVADAATGGATCQPEPAALADGANCDAHEACRHGACMFDQCVSLCMTDNDCLTGQRCRQSPFLADRFAVALAADDPPPMVGHCLPDTAALAFSVPVHNMDGRYAWLPIPSGALSFVVGSYVTSGNPLVGAAALIAPDAQIAYTWPQTDSEYIVGARYAPSPQTSLFGWPRPNGSELADGAYRVDLGVFSPARTRLAAPAVANVVVRMLPLATLDMVVYILDTEDHPCTPALAADNIATSEFSTKYVPALRETLLQAGIVLRDVFYQDVVDRGDLDEIAQGDLATLQEANYTDGALNMYIVRSIAPAGLAVAVRGVPSRARDQLLLAPVAVSLAARCYLSWERLARATARELAIYAGVWPTVDLGGITDQFSDTSVTSENLLHPAEAGGSQLSGSQRFFWREHMVVP